MFLEKHLPGWQVANKIMSASRTLESSLAGEYLRKRTTYYVQLSYAPEQKS